VNSELMTVDDVAADLHISKRHVYILIKRDLKPVVRFGNLLRIERRVVNQYVEDHRVPQDAQQPFQTQRNVADAQGAEAQV
jgi:excisionase family DNA binding protein